MSPESSSPGLAFLLATVNGTDDWEEYWADLVANGVSVTAGWSDAYYGEFTAGGGDRSIVVSYVEPAAEVIFADPPVDTAPTGVLLDSCFRQIEFAGILAGTEHRAEAEALIDFMLTQRSRRTCRSTCSCSRHSRPQRCPPSSSSSPRLPTIRRPSNRPSSKQTVTHGSSDGSRSSWAERTDPEQRAMNRLFGLSTRGVLVAVPAVFVAAFFLPDRHDPVAASAVGEARPSSIWLRRRASATSPGSRSGRRSQAPCSPSPSDFPLRQLSPGRRRDAATRSGARHRAVRAADGRRRRCVHRGVRRCRTDDGVFGFVTPSGRS